MRLLLALLLLGGIQFHGPQVNVLPTFTGLVVTKTGDVVTVVSPKQRWTVRQNPSADDYGKAEWHISLAEVLIGGAYKNGYAAISDNLVSGNNVWMGNGHGNMSDPSAITWKMDGVSFTPSTSEVRGATLVVEQTTTGYEHPSATPLVTAAFVSTWTGETFRQMTTYTALADFTMTNLYVGMTEFDLCGDVAWSALWVNGLEVLANAGCPDETLYQNGPSVTGYSLRGPGGVLTVSISSPVPFLGVDSKAYLVQATSAAKLTGSITSAEFVRTLE